jgi:protein-tyrosine phosphatase
MAKMYYAILDGETVDRSGTLKTLFPNSSFPLSGPNEDFKEENNLVEVLEYLEHDSETQKMIFCDPYLLDGSVYRVELVDFTSEELESNLAGIEEFESLQGE